MNNSCAVTGHAPVMLAEVMRALNVRQGALYLDATFGGGGYSRAILSIPQTRVVAVDRDPDAEKRAQPLVQSEKGRFEFVAACFGDLAYLSERFGLFDGIVFDLGVSSFQLDQAERGFSFRHDGPLDMRMSRSGVSAAQLVQEAEERDLADIFFRYGEEPKARAIARAIVRARALTPITTTHQLASVVQEVVPFSPRGVHPATRVFMALRIAVNEELRELERGLQAAHELLAQAGRLVVVSFHSLEDRIVKEFMRAHDRVKPTGSRYQPATENYAEPTMRVLYNRPLLPQSDETIVNPRARSAKLRAAELTQPRHHHLYQMCH